MIELPEPAKIVQRMAPKCWAPRGYVQFSHSFLGEVVQSGLSGSAIRLLLAIADEVLGFAGRGPSTDSGQGYWAKKTGIRKSNIHRYFDELHAAGWIQWQPGKVKQRGTATLLILPAAAELPAGRETLHQNAGTPYPQSEGTPTLRVRAELPSNRGQNYPQSEGTIKKRRKERLFKKPEGAKSAGTTGAPGTSSKRLVQAPQIQEQPEPEQAPPTEAAPIPAPEPPPPPKAEKPSFPKPSADERARWKAALDQVGTLARRSATWLRSAAGLELLAWGSAGAVEAWHPDEGAGREACEFYGAPILAALRAADPTVSTFTVHGPGGPVSVEPTPAEAAA